MDISEYKNKAYSLLDDQNTYTKLPHVPAVTTIQSKFNTQVRNIARDIEDDDQRKLVLSKVSDPMPSLPYFYVIRSYDIRKMNFICMCLCIHTFSPSKNPLMKMK